MAEAMARGFVAGGAARFSDIAVSHGGNPSTPERWRALGVDVLSSNAEILDRCDVVFFAVKPHILPCALNECGAHVDVDRHLFVSVAAGVSTRFIEDKLRTEDSASQTLVPRVVRVDAQHAVRGWRSRVRRVRGLARDRGGRRARPRFNAKRGRLRARRGRRLTRRRHGRERVGAGVRVCVHRGYGGRRSGGGPTARARQPALAAQTLLGAARMVPETGEHPGAR